MKKRLSIVAPRYREGEKEMFPLLASIAGQVGIDLRDVEVVIGNDGGGAGPLGDEYLAQFGVDVRQVQLEKNQGCGMARQAAIDIAEGDYIYFCDADDALHNVLSLSLALNEIEKTGADILTTDFLEELAFPDGSRQYIRHAGHIGCWMHGKIMRRQFLVENDIRFHPAFREHEDAYFLCLAFSESQNTRYMPELTYVWKNNPDSITRRDGAIYTYESVPVYVNAVTTSWERIEKRHPEQMRQRVLQFIFYHYFMLHRQDWIVPERARYRQTAEEAFAKGIAPYWHYYQEATPEEIASEYNAERDRSFQGGVETETLGDWLARVAGYKTTL